jgi:hypothetical protein
MVPPHPRIRDHAWAIIICQNFITRKCWRHASKWSSLECREEGTFSTGISAPGLLCDGRLGTLTNLTLFAATSPLYLPEACTNAHSCPLDGHHGHPSGSATDICNFLNTKMASSLLTRDRVFEKSMRREPKGLAAIPRRRDIPANWGRVFCHLSVISHVPILPIVLGARYDTKGPPIWNPDNRRAEKKKNLPIYAYAQDRPRLTNTRTLEEKLVCGLHTHHTSC